MKNFAVFALTVLLIGQCALTGAEKDLALGFEADGTAVVENSLLRLRVTNGTGRTDGIRSWFFKLTGYEMVDVLYRQLDAGGGHLLGLLWDAVQLENLPSGAPDCGRLFIPRVAAVDETGRGALLLQVSEGDYRLSRTLIIRRDLAMVEARIKLENVSGRRLGSSLRLHNVASPGARGQYQAGNDVLFMQTEAGPVSWRQELPNDAFKKQYGSDRCLLPIVKQQPKSMWTNIDEKPPLLADNFAALVNPDNGDGLVTLVAQEQLLGFYNCPNITVEPLFQGFALSSGESWETTVWLGAFTGTTNKAVVDATPLYVATETLTHRDGHLEGELIPFFNGRLRIVGSDGKTAEHKTASPDHLLVLDVAVDEDWSLIALDRQGKEIGRINTAGNCTLYQPDIALTPPRKPTVDTDVYMPSAADESIREFVQARDYAIQCDSTVSEEIRQLAEELALKLGVGLAETPRYKGKMIAFGSPGRSVVVRNAGLLKSSLDAEWPGDGKGAILYYDNFESTSKPLLLVGGSNPAGALVAARTFRDRYVSEITPAKGWKLWTTPLSTHVMDWSRPDQHPVTDTVTLTAAGNEYESAQFVVTAYEPLTAIEATVEPLVHEATGEEISRRFITFDRRRKGPLRLRWAAPFPLYPVDGWPGTPDALLDRPLTSLAAGRSQVLWLTVMIARDAEPGRYHSAVHVKANGTQQSIPIELEVRDFTLPLTGVKGEAYMAMHLLADDGCVRSFEVDRLIRTLVEHRFRIMHLTEPQLLRWHLSPEGAFKEISTDFLLSNEDGTLLLDTSRFDWLVDRCDQIAKPFQLEYVVPGLLTIGWPKTINDFKRAFPDRYSGLPERGGHPMQSHWAQEMLELFKRHLERRGIWKRVLVKIGDEPGGFDTWWNEFATAARESGVRFGTAFNSIDWRQAEKALGTNLAQFQPLYQRFDPDFARRVQEAGQEIGWYNCGPPPRIGIGTDAAEFRAYYWQAARYDLDFVARWGIQCWGTEGNTPTNMWTFKYAHHNSVLYNAHPDLPPYVEQGRGWVDTPPLDSIRFELIREGLEDADYVWVLRRAIEEAEKNGDEKAAAEGKAVLKRIWTEVYPSLNQYNPPYPVLMQCREQVAQAILKLKTNK